MPRRIKDRPKTNPMFFRQRPGTFKVTKMQAAVSQLDTAIRLFFYDGDLVAICTLSHAAWKIIRNLNESYKAQPAMDPKEYAHEVEGIERMFHDVYSGEANYFRHSGSDSGAAIYFDPTITLSLIMDSIFIFQQWPVPQNPVFEAFICWVRYCHPTPPQQDPNNVGQKLASLKAMFRRDRKEFFDKTLPVLTAKLAESPGHKSN